MKNFNNTKWDMAVMVRIATSEIKNINKYVWLKNIERFESWVQYGEYGHRNVLFRLPEKQPEINNI